MAGKTEAALEKYAAAMREYQPERYLFLRAADLYEKQGNGERATNLRRQAAALFKK